jgi:hypothetical protein
MTRCVVAIATLNTGITTNGQTTQKFFYNVPSSNPFQKFFGRLDYDITRNNRLTLSETESDNPAIFLNQGICPVNCQTGDVSRDNAQVSDVWTISPHLINEARFGFTDQLNFFQPYSLNQGYPAKLGWKFAKANVFPTINVTGVVSPNPRKFRHSKFSPAMTASRSMSWPLLRKV